MPGLALGLGLSSLLVGPRPASGGPDLTFLALANATIGGAAPVECLDVGDIASYAGSGDWISRGSSATHFELGNNLGILPDPAFVPTFVGTPGTKDETTYFRSDFDANVGAAGTLFYPTSAWADFVLPPGTAWTVIMLMSLPAYVATPHGMFVLSDDGDGALERRGAADVLGKVRWFNTGAFDKALALDTTSAGMKMVALSINEAGGAGASFVYHNKTAVTFDGSYGGHTLAKTSSLNVEPTPFGSTTGFPQNSKIFGFFAYNRALTTAALDSFYDSVKTNRLASLP